MPNSNASPEVLQVAVAQAEAVARSSKESEMYPPSQPAPRVSQRGSPSSRIDPCSSLKVPEPETMSNVDHEIPIEQQPPPIFSTEHGQVDCNQDGFDTKAKVASDGRLNININQKSRRLSDLLVPALRSQLNLQHVEEPPTPPPGYIPSSLGGLSGKEPPPPLNVVIHVVGSRGDVQPFIALGKVLKETYHHRVRLATHSTFKSFVEESGLEYFNIGGDPAELMAFMVKNPGLMPGMDSLKSGDVGKRRKGMYEIVQGCWRSCIEVGDGNGIPASDQHLDSRSRLDSSNDVDDASARPFVADAIIANPPSFAHIHCAEKLGIPLHLMFTMPWSPTQAFPHPLANIQSSNADPSITNFVSYALVEMMTWQGLGDIINRFRERSLGLEPVSLMWAPGMAARLRIPYTYCWSPALIPKPKDWDSHISISGFYFLSLASSFAPEPDLEAFLDAGPPPIYIGFGSIVVDDPNAMTKLIFEAVKQTGHRALVSKGWGGFGADTLGIPDGVFMLGNVPHDWLFERVSCVVHHGGAGTTAAGIAFGKPTVIVPFFGDQPFWGAMVAKAGAGPKPIPSKQLTADNLAAGIQDALKPESLAKAQELGARISSEKGTDAGAQSFHGKLDVDSLRCTLAPSRAAVWRVKRTQIRLSAFAATTLSNEGSLDFNDLKLYRPREYDSEDGPWDPISGGASALLGTIGSLMMGFADFPVEILRALKIRPAEPTEHAEGAMAPETDASKSNTSSKVSLDSTKEASSIGDEQSGVKGSVEAQRSLSGQMSPVETPVLSPVGSKEKHCSTKALSGALRDSLSGSPSRDSRSSSPSRTSTSPHQRRGSSHMSLETALGAGKGIGRIVGAGVKSPMDFTLGIARGFHNAPKLYGDESVRQAEKITGIQSGLKAAGKEFGYGFFDGISGLITQPLEGAKKEGVAGLVKGFGKGIGGVVLKPGAAIWGLPGYTFKGIYKEIQKHFGASVQNYIVAARTTQGYEDWNKSTHKERLDVVSRWQAAQVELSKRKQLHHHSGPHAHASHGRTKHPTRDDRKKLSAEKQSRTMQSERLLSNNAQDLHDIAPLSPDNVSLSNKNPDFAEFEEAIHAAIAATTRGNPEEDQTIERAIRASILELQSASQQDGEGAAIQRAIKVSIAEAQRSRAFQPPEASVSGLDGTHGHDKDLEAALQRSLREHHERDQQSSSATTESDDASVNIDDDENVRVAIQKSKTDVAGGNTRDKDLEEAIRLSKEQHQATSDDFTNPTTEEQIVVEYVKKQSALEEEHRAKLGNPQANTDPQAK